MHERTSATMSQPYRTIFGLDIVPNMGDVVIVDSYFVLAESSITAYTGTWASVGRFHGGDYAAVQYDDSVVQIHAVPGTGVWRVEASP